MSQTAPFGAYAAFYDALYRDKDYAGECNTLERIFERFAASPVRQILDLGCGTGGHAVVLASRGYAVTGVDRSSEMLALAREKSRRLRLRVRFQEGDIRCWRGGRTWDAAIAMFAVLSYQATHQDAAAALESARQHLAPLGLFVFDIWFGPGVLTDPPSERVKETREADHEIVRYASSRLDVVAQTVDVDYLIIDVDRQRTAQRVCETHRLRFFFPTELDLLLRASRFRLIHLCPSGQLGVPIGRETWNVTAVAQAV